MENFFLRVELHNDDRPKDYDDLHTALFDIKFYRAVKGENEKWFDLPHGTYYGESALEIDQLKETIKNLIDTIFTNNPSEPGTTKSYSILVIKSEISSWYLLSPADINRLP